ncbi:substrate-binding periplasmic protein [Agarivorans litoreus]|uniref:substrate-binding periplasmic protein n=1 Tax=Agarivorans litoreus TaxID=1510455 RepID=UPI001C7CE7D1|nr:transporter substrate-binding domain-containing protein [Agarivorans litoreus]
MYKGIQWCWFALFLLASSWSHAHTLRLVTHHLPPYQELEHDVVSGSMVSLMQCSLTAIEQDYELDLRPIGRAIKEFKSGQFDGVFVLNRTAERDRFATASEPLIVTYRSLFSVNKVDVELHSAAMKELKIGVLYKSAMHNWLIEHDYPNIHARHDYHILFELLQLGRIDAIVGPDEIYEYEKSHGHVTRNIEIRHLSQADLSSYFSTAWLALHPNFLRRFNSALRNCKKSYEHQDHEGHDHASRNI